METVRNIKAPMNAYNLCQLIDCCRWMASGVLNLHACMKASRKTDKTTYQAARKLKIKHVKTHSFVQRVVELCIYRERFAKLHNQILQSEVLLPMHLLLCQKSSGQVLLRRCVPVSERNQLKKRNMN